MKVLDPGHLYDLCSYDGDARQQLRFMKRDGPGYPGNSGTYPGTNCQEVIRALINRVSYLNGQIPCPENEGILRHLREALYLFELRAAARHGREGKFRNAVSVSGIEQELSCVKCGHLQCQHTEADSVG